MQEPVPTTQQIAESGATATATPSLMPTPILPTSTSRPSYPAPALLSPQDWEELGDENVDILLEWESVGSLGPNDFYLVDIECDIPPPDWGQPHASLLTQETKLHCEGNTTYKCWARSGSAIGGFGARYGYASAWKVTVVRVQDGHVVSTLGPASETRHFVWRIP